MTERVLSGQEKAESEIEPQTVDAVDAQGFTAADIKHNMKFCIMLDVIWATGWADFQMALVPLLTYLNASNTMIGMISGAAFAAVIGIIISPWITRRFRIKKWYMTALNIPYLLPIGAIGIVLVMSHRIHVSNEWLLSFIIIATIAHKAVAGFVALPHQEYVAACIPASHRGRYSGLSGSFGSVFAIGSSALGGLILAKYAKPMSFGYLFLMTWIICQTGYVVALFAREKPTPVEKSPPAWSRQMFKSAWDDKRFVRLMAFILLPALTYGPVGGFITVYAFRDLKMAAAMAAVFSILTQVVRIVTWAPIGHVVDKFGGKRVLPFCTLFSGLTFLVAATLQNAWGIYISMVILAFNSAMWSSSLNTLVYGLPKPENRAGYYTFQLLMNYVTIAIGPILAGRLCDVLTYRSVFFIASGCAFALFPVAKYMLSVISDDASDLS